jgi:hypothetical protein
MFEKWKTLLVSMTVKEGYMEKLRFKENHES